MRHSTQDGVRQNAALFANGAARKTAIFFVFSNMKASTIWLLRCTYGNPLGSSAGNLSLFSLGMDRFLTPAVPPLQECRPSSNDADDGPGIFKSCYGTLLSETWTEGPGPTHVAAVLPAATASSSESPEPTTAGVPNVL